jgi:cell division protease FtsH
MDAMANALLEFETIDAEQIDDIMAGRPPRPPKPAQPAGGTGSGSGGNPAPAAPSATTTPAAEA